MKGNKGIIARAIEFLRNPGDWNAKNEDERNEVLRSNVWKMTIICSVMYVIEIGIFVTNIYNSIAVQRVVFTYLVVASILLPITFWVNNKYKRGFVKRYSKLGIILQVIYSTLTILFGVEIAALSREGYNTILVYYIMVTSTSAFIYMNIKMGTTMIFGTYLYFVLRVLSTQHDTNIIILMLSNTIFFNIGSAVLTSLQYRNQLVNIRQDKQLKEDIDKTELLSKISTNYITIDQNNVETKMYETVKQIGEHFRAGRVKMQIRGSGKDYRNRYYWRNRKAGVSKENTVICTIEKKKKPEGKIIIEGMEKRETEAEILKYIANLIINALDKVDNEIEVSRLAYYDTLTGLANRMLYKNRLCTALQMVKRSGKQLAVMFIDLDGFKQVNDTAGHEGGDEILKTIARRLEDNVRKYDTVARFGGDEYLILLQNIENIEDVTEVANKIIPLCNEPIKYRGVNYNVSASIGIAIAPLDGDDVETLIKCADDAMYKAKEEGKNQYSFCTGEIKKDKKEEANIKTKIKTAIENGEMRIVYQPQVEIGTEKIIAMEALVRWENNEIGNIEPNQFIPIAENTGDIRKIGKWVMEEVMKQIKKWNQEDAINIPVAVNVSLEQMKAKDYPEEVIKLKEEYGIEDGQLGIELTESKGITQNTAVIKALHQLKRNGIKITMDDFGMEYSTYNRVKRLPLDKIKIAKEMMGEMDKTAGDGALLQSLVTMAKTLNVEIIAEGIEYAKQEEMLRRANCNYAQGFYYYRPMEPEEVMEVITESNKVKVMEGV